MLPCPKCGHNRAADVHVCPACGGSVNGVTEGVPRSAFEPASPPSEQLQPELKEWARQQFSEEEFLAGLREIQTTGGSELQDFLQELEQEAAPDA